MPFDTVIRGGTVVTPTGAVRTDVAIRGERIAAIGEGLEAPGAAVIDAQGHLVVPGAIDVHVHLDLPVAGTVTADDYRSGTRAAARGGVTTVIDFATPAPRPGGAEHESLSEAVDAWHRRAEGKALIDYAFHVAITRWAQQRGEVRGLIDRGIPTFKEYMVYDDIKSDDAAIFETLETVRDAGGMLLVHAESDCVLGALIRRHHTPAMMRRFGARLHRMTRPNYIEAEAIQRVLTWAEITGGPLHIVHMSTREGADLVRRAQERGVRVLAETCAQYLVLDDSVFDREDGHLYATCPQVKGRADSERLWDALRAGEVAIVATDTCSFTREQKDAWQGDWTRIPMGMPGVETLLPILYTHGVLAGRLTLAQMVEKLATNPARHMGLAPRKGAIAVGADADLVIFHPTERLTVRAAHMESAAGWSPYEGWELAGFPRTVLSRGEVIVDNGAVVGREGRGQWLPRRLS